LTINSCSQLVIVVTRFAQWFKQSSEKTHFKISYLQFFRPFEFFFSSQFNVRGQCHHTSHTKPRIFRSSLLHFFTHSSSQNHSRHAQQKIERVFTQFFLSFFAQLHCMEKVRNAKNKANSRGPKRSDKHSHTNYAMCFLVFFLRTVRWADFRVISEKMFTNTADEKKIIL
jgi:hypothetical protein